MAQVATNQDMVRRMPFSAVAGFPELRRTGRSGPGEVTVSLWPYSDSVVSMPATYNA